MAVEMARLVALTSPSRSTRRQGGQPLLTRTSVLRRPPARLPPVRGRSGRVGTDARPRHEVRVNVDTVPRCRLRRSSTSHLTSTLLIARGSVQNVVEPSVCLEPTAGELYHAAISPRALAKMRGTSLRRCGTGQALEVGLEADVVTPRSPRHTDRTIVVYRWVPRRVAIRGSYAPTIASHRRSP